MKKLLVVLGVLALAVTARAGVPVPIVNGDFELVGPASGQNRCVDILDVLADGSLDGHLVNAGQPCGPWNAQGWVVNDGPGISADGWGTDSRWGDWWNAWISGPTNGVNTIIADNRTWEGGGRIQDSTMIQDIGSVGDLTANYGTSLTMLFDARYDGGGQDADDWFAAYFQVNGVVQAAGEFRATLDATNPIPNWANLPGGDPRPGYGAAVKGNPGGVKPGTEGPQNMATFSATADITGMDPNARVEIVLYNHREDNNGSGSPTNRIYLDNVRVEAETLQPQEGYLHIVKFVDDCDGIYEGHEEILPNGMFMFEVVETGQRFVNCEEILLPEGVWHILELPMPGWIDCTGQGAPYEIAIAGGQMLELFWGNMPEPGDVIPEPATLALLGLGAIGLVIRRR
jgi:hypothetical protein